MRSHYCGQVTEDLLGQEVVLCGWVHRRRDHGGVIFIDLRDREGLVQVVFDPDTEEAFATAEQVRSEFVLQVEGRAIQYENSASITARPRTPSIAQSTASRRGGR